MAAKPPAYNKQLHFFPGALRLIWLMKGQRPVHAEAWGGEEPEMGVTYDVMKPRPTTPGRYIIYSFAPYRTNTWEMSKIRWGTKLLLDASGRHVLFSTGIAQRPWRRVQSKIPLATPAAIRATYRAYYGTSQKYDTNGDGIPDSWVFNDFGPWAVRYFRDTNKNKKLDAGESLSGEMIHTTPENEAQAAKGEPIILSPSHGCVHISPFDRDKFRQLGAFDRGVVLVIHPYADDVPDDMK